MAPVAGHVARGSLPALEGFTTVACSETNPGHFKLEGGELWVGRTASDLGVPKLICEPAEDGRAGVAHRAAEQCEQVGGDERA